MIDVRGIELASGIGKGGLSLLVLPEKKKERYAKGKGLVRVVAKRFVWQCECDNNNTFYW